MILPALFTFFFGVCLLTAALSDLRSMRIGNDLSLALLGGFAVGAILVLFGQDVSPILSSNLWSHGVAFALVAAVTLPLFYLGLFGGGDTKFLPVVALWVGLGGLPLLLFVMSVTGGVLALLSLALPKYAGCKAVQWPEGSWPARLLAGERGVPYGVAIAAGGIAAALQPYFANGG